MRKILRFLLLGGLLTLVLGLGLVFWFLRASADLGSAYSAKLLASGVFVAGRTPESIASQELGFVPRLEYTVDREARTVTAWTAPRHKKTAVYREGLGAALALDGGVEALRQQARPDLIPDLSSLAEELWPMGDAPSGRSRPAGIDEARLTATVDRMFQEPNPWYKRRTRAVIIVYDDEIVAERYAEGFGAEQRFPAWSMSKSVLHALYGIAVRQGKLSVSDPAPIPLWKGQDDPRSAITIDMLLRMSSGLKYNELDFVPPADLTTMLFLRPDAADYAAHAPLAHPPDTVWSYSSGTANILSWILRQAYGDDAYYALPYQELFRKIGMRNAIIEADASGTLVFSSFLFATTRDYARFGLLYLHDGVWQGERILPERWAEYARTPTPAAPRQEYGAHWWLPSVRERSKAQARGVSLPEDMFFAQGFEGQNIFVIPSRKLVIVRLGLAYFAANPPHDFVLDILQALPQPG
jgi:CubicO group peptidase (beta-lactamase class C family)